MLCWWVSLMERHIHRGVTFKTGEDFTSLLGVRQRLGRLGLEEVHDGNPIRAAHHERVVRRTTPASSLSMMLLRMSCVFSRSRAHDSSD